MVALFALVLLAQVQGHWVDFEICRVRNAVAEGTGNYLSLWITNERAPGLVDILPRPRGIACVQMIYRGESAYVVGTREQIKRLLVTDY